MTLASAVLNRHFNFHCISGAAKSGFSTQRAAKLDIILATTGFPINGKSPNIPYYGIHSIL